MKVKNLIMGILLGAAAVVGTAYGVGKGMQKKDQAVEVAPIANLNEASMYAGMMGSSTLYGTIISKDTQTVELDSDHTIKEVYVEAGDKVKKGDKLMTYDMELDKLKREAEELTKQGLELTLETMRKDLVTMQNGRIPENYNNGYINPGTYSMGDLDDEEGSDIDAEEDDLTYSAQTVAEETLPESSSGGDIIEQEDTDAQEDIPGEDPESQILPDEPGGEDVPPQNNSMIEDDIASGNDVEPDEAVFKSINAFLTDVNALTEIANGGFDDLESEEAAGIFEDAFSIFQEKLSISGETTIADLFGDSRVVRVYQVKETIEAMVGRPTAKVLSQAYDRLCVYRYIKAVRAIFPGMSGPSSDYDYDMVKAVSDRIHAAADAFYVLQDGVYYVDDSGRLRFSSQFAALNEAYGSESYAQYMLGLIRTLNTDPSTIFPGYMPDTEMTETDTPPDIPEPGGGDGPTAEELRQAIEQQKKNIKEYELQIREADLSIKEYDRTLDHETVKADMDGIVKQAGTTTEQPSSGGFIVITGKAGMYVQGTLSERTLDSLRIGDTITGSSWDTGASFSAKITEISRYPMDSGGNSYFFYDSSSDPNSSQYPFLAYIDNADGLTTDSTVELSISQSQSSENLMLEPYLVRVDDSGKTFCYVRGEDGLLEKRYVKTKDSDFGITIILSGLKADDYLAFPYGDGVKEGVPTQKVDSLSAVSGDSLMLS